MLFVASAYAVMQFGYLLYLVGWLVWPSGQEAFYLQNLTDPKEE